MTSNIDNRIPWWIRRWWHLAIFAFIFWSIGLGITLPTKYKLSTRGVSAEASITGEYGHGKKMVTCKFDVAGKSYSAIASTPEDGSHSSVDYSPGLVGMIVLVTYDPNNPNTNLGGDKRGRFVENLCISLFGILFLSLFVGYVAHLFKQHYLRKVNAETDGK